MWHLPRVCGRGQAKHPVRNLSAWSPFGWRSDFDFMNPPLSSQSLDRASLTNFCLNARLILLHPVPRHLRSSSSFSLKSLAFKLFLLQHPSICCGWKEAQRLPQKCKGKQKLHGKAWDFHSLREIRSPESHGNSEKSRVHNFPLCL